MAYGNSDATFEKNGYIIFQGFRIRSVDSKSGLKYVVDLGMRSGKHVRKRLDSVKEAKAFALQKRTEADNEGLKAMNFTEVQKNDAVQALELLSEYRVSLKDAANYFIKNNRVVDHTNSTDILIGTYLEYQNDKMQRGALRSRSYNDCAKYLKVFREELGHMALDTISGVEIDAWLDKKEFAPTNRENHKRYISGFFNWCVKRDLLDVNPTIKCRETQKIRKRVRIYEVDDVKTIMDKAVAFANEDVVRCENQEQNTVQRVEIVPYLALGFFAGLRPDEIRRLSWKDIDFSNREIHVNADTSKTSFERTVHIQANLVPYLTPYRKKGSQLIFPLSETSLTRWRQDVFKRAGIKSIQDGARHTFATYFLALNSIDDTTLELGHSTNRTLFNHYLGLSKNRKEKAKQYFEIGLSKKKIIEFGEGAA